VLIDFITAGLDLAQLSAADQATLRNHGERICKYSPLTGTIAWEVSTWDSVRSDSHQISIRVTSDRLMIKGSPARVIGDGDAAFGAGAARALDLVGCLERMAGFVCTRLGIVAPEVRQWHVSRTDTTGMLLLGSLADVRAALTILRNCEGGRYRVSQQAGDTVYWSHKSRLKAGKAYAKGPHLRQAQVKRGYCGRRYSEEELEAVDHCLRLELTHGAQFWRERVGCEWWQVRPEWLREWHSEYFGRMLGAVEVTEMNVEERVKTVASSEGQAKAAIGCWALIRSYGWEKARAMTARRTWYRNLKVLRDAGLSDADLSAGKVVAIRRPLIECQEVNSWDELLAAVRKRAA
jgi:II/X family phage/plasmid replication protein